MRFDCHDRRAIGQRSSQRHSMIADGIDQPFRLQQSRAESVAHDLDCGDLAELVESRERRIRVRLAIDEGESDVAVNHPIVVVGIDQRESREEFANGRTVVEVCGKAHSFV